MRPIYTVTVKPDEFTQAASTAFDYKFEGESKFVGDFCSHVKCHLCLKCEKELGERMKKYGQVQACERCVDRAIQWAYDTARKWGGEYRTECPKK